MPTSNIAKIAAIAVAGLCLAVSACGKKGADTTANDAMYSSAFPSATSDSDLGSSAPSQVADSQLPGMAPAYSATNS